MSKMQEATLKELHPTQLTIGHMVVQNKKKPQAALKAADPRSFMKDHPMPAVLGQDAHRVRGVHLGRLFRRNIPGYNAK
jgi:hypothetical protein